jgi:biotin transport system substrate-specific component
MPKPIPPPIQFLWALAGLLLTIGGTFLEAFATTPPWAWTGQGIKTVSLGVTYQIGAVLLTGCLGGARAGALSQIAYIAIGLTWLPVFDRGGGWGYMKSPSFGYILGFVAGAWVCGWLAFRVVPRLESLAFSSLCGLLTIHGYGIAYLLIFQYVGNLHWVNTNALPLGESILRYSVYPLPGQLALVCAVAVLSFLLRRVMFY